MSGLARKFGLTPDQLGENLRDNYQRHETELLNQMKQLKITLVGEKTFHFAANQNPRTTCVGRFTNNLFIFTRGMNFQELLVAV